MQFTDLVTVNHIIPDIKSTSKNDVIQELLEPLKLTKKESDAVLKLIIEREKRGTTGMGEGLALPHTNQAAVAAMVGVFGRSHEGVDFDALDGRPVHIFFLILSGEGHQDQHIEGLRYISRQMRNAIYKRFLMEAAGKRGILAILKELDRKDKA